MPTTYIPRVFGGTIVINTVPPTTGLVVTISGVPVLIKVNTLQVVDALAQRTTCTFVVEDPTGTANYQYGQQVSVTDYSATNSVLFTGYVFDATPLNKYPQPNNEIAVTCMDQHYLADKHIYSDVFEEVNQYAGNIAIRLLSTYLAQEGVTANYAFRRDTTNTNWNAGTLNNTVGTLNVGDGDLELALAGSAVNKIESTTANFNSGTLSNTQSLAGNAGLTLTQHAATQFQATCLGYNASGGSFANFGIWNGNYIIQTGDVLQYTMWVSSTSPQITASVDGACSDGTVIGSYAALNPFQIRDQNGMHASATQDLSGFANDTWYFRTIDIGTPLHGKTLNSLYLSFAGTSKGQYNAYFYTIQIYNNNTLSVNLSTSISNGSGSNFVFGNSIVQQGYTNVSASAVTAYDPNGYRISNATPLAPVGVIGSSIISWQQTIPVSPLAGATSALANATIYTSQDGVTWQGATDLAAIPSLIVGASTSGTEGQNLYFKEVLSIVGPDPTIAPILNSVSATVNPTYNATKNDVGRTVSTQTQWQNGTLTNLTAQSNNSVTLPNANSRNWDAIATGVSNQTLYGGGSPAQITVNRNLALTATTGNDARSRFDFANKFNQLDMSVLVQVPTGTNENIGMEWGTTSWGNGLNSYAYVAYITPTQLKLSRGQNNGATGGAEVNISTITFSTALTAGSWHTLRVQWGQTGNVIQVYLDGTQYINLSDNTYPSGGTTAYVAARFYNGSGATDQGYVATFSIASNLTNNVYTAQNLSLNSAGTAGNSIIYWGLTQPNGSSIVCTTSIDGGTTWQTATNGGQIPGLTNGVSVTGVNLKVKFTFNSTDPSLQPVLFAYTAWISSQYVATGTRISPALSLNPVGRVGNSFVGWNANLPTGPTGNTTLKVETSPTGSGSWTNVTSSNGGSIPGEYIQPSPQFDPFAVDSHTSYTQTFLNGGTASSWTWDTANNRLLSTQSSGKRGYLQYTTFGARADMFVEADFSVSDSAGLIVRQVDSSNCYFVTIADGSSASQTANTVHLKKMVAGTVSNVGAAATISFPRNSIHRFRLDIQGSTITLLMDSVQVTQQTDVSITAGGYAGIIASVATGDMLTCYSLRIQPYGDSLAGANIYTRVTLTSNDPTLTPQVLDLTVAASSPNINIGSLVPVTSYSLYNGNTTTIASCFDDLVSKSTNYWWNIDDDLNFFFQQRLGQPAPFVLATVNSHPIPGFTGGQASGDVLLKNCTVKNASPLYRNDEWIIGGSDVLTDQKLFVGDGSTTSWNLNFPVAGSPATPPVFTVNGVVQLAGIQGQSTGMAFYYTPGQTGITQDASQTPLINTQTLKVVYQGLEPVVSHAQDTVEQAAYQAVEGRSGIVSMVESFPGLNKAANDALATSRLNQNKVRGQIFTCDTLRGGLQSGQLVGIFCSQYSLQNLQAIISKVTINIVSVAMGASSIGYLPMYTVEATSGPVAGDWSKFAAAPYKPRKSA